MPSSPSAAWSAEQQAAIAAAKARYATALAAIDKALGAPNAPARPPLEAAGVSDKRMVAAIADARTLRDSGWYRSGSAKIVSVTPTAVELDSAQPKVALRSCVDFSSTAFRFQKDHKVVPVAASSSKRVSFSAEFRYTTRPGTSTKLWFFTDETAGGPC
ncbi:hypothetical protein ACXJJ3_09310 [Kribbella sp. WER1]